MTLVQVEFSRASNKNAAELYFVSLQPRGEEISGLIFALTEKFCRSVKGLSLKGHSAVRILLRHAMKRYCAGNDDPCGRYLQNRWCRKIVCFSASCLHCRD
jgi:hypothetical protein